jgi:hypothetical protein
MQCKQFVISFFSEMVVPSLCIGQKDVDGTFIDLFNKDRTKIMHKKKSKGTTQYNLHIRQRVTIMSAGPYSVAIGEDGWGKEKSDSPSIIFHALHC